MGRNTRLLEHLLIQFDYVVGISQVLTLVYSGLGITFGERILFDYLPNRVLPPQISLYMDYFWTSLQEFILGL